jgi:hypothetical protein
MRYTGLVLVCECDNECTHWEIGIDFIKCKTCNHVFEGVRLMGIVSALTSTKGTIASFKEREI